MARRTLALVLLLAAAPPLGAQNGSPRLGLDLPERMTAGLSVPATRIAGVLTEGHRRDLLNSGWPTAIHARVELWRKGFLGMFDRESVIEWDVIVEYAPATKVYHLRRIVDNRVEELGEASTIEAAEQILRRPFSAALPPRSSGGRYFYVFGVDISTLSLSDLEAWQRWVRGEARPAVSGKRNPATALQRGLGSLLSRVLGGDTQSYETRSGVFSAG
ncbi:MAG TPA: hypothetical protein VFO55_10090 [Gemmatimonadaceae bacterium]|nr:hypothetical protein [Gemmatimonadaceae bacterium]